MKSIYIVDRIFRIGEKVLIIEKTTVPKKFMAVESSLTMHEIDYLVYLLGFPEECKKFQSKVSNLEIDSNDFSHYCLKYGSFFAMVTLNY